MPMENEAVNSPAQAGVSAQTQSAAVGVGAKLSQMVARLKPTSSLAASSAMSEDQPDNVDSFGQVISERDRQVNADTRPLPQFVNGVLATSGVSGSSESQSVAPVASVDKSEPVTPPEKKTSQVVMAILCVLAVLAVGIAVFWLWYRLNAQILYWRRETEARNEQIQQLQVEIADAKEENQQSTARLPLYIDPNGYFSFYKEIPSLSVKATGGVARLFYGETDGENPLAGFVMTIEVLPTNGRALDTIVNADYEHAANGVNNSGKRNENIAEHFGFSYVAYEGNNETIYYYLQDKATSKRYAKVSYRIRATTDSEYDNYDQTALSILMNLELYEID